MFDVKQSLFTLRSHCLDLEKKDSEDVMEYTGRNRDIPPRLLAIWIRKKRNELERECDRLMTLLKTSKIIERTQLEYMNTRRDWSH
ncbi:hypothetical protein ANCDUO_12251 [Ancylostoma duodenale]|uniref:Uncharacterized protein n=1 Tax=Ancylostoma duodenale TaxID=51022 RepID=A0A0C2GF76_9BILA|nr:hypothetical protein ANCDUO_12251 [Ancylostoma duodenale]